jgi:tetratricopeptide (TPR) repeat protein
MQPDSGAYYIGKAQCLEGLKRLNEALVAYDKGISLAPNTADFRNMKGTALSRMGRYDDALKAFDTALELDSKLAGAVYNRACVFSLRGEKAKALTELKAAIGMNADFKQMAPRDEDFKSLWDDPDFKALVK